MVQEEKEALIRKLQTIEEYLTSFESQVCDHYNILKQPETTTLLFNLERRIFGKGWKNTVATSFHSIKLLTLILPILTMKLCSRCNTGHDSGEFISDDFSPDTRLGAQLPSGGIFTHHCARSSNESKAIVTSNNFDLLDKILRVTFSFSSLTYFNIH